MELRLLIRQLPIYNKNGQQIYYDGTAPYDLQATVGTLPAPRRFPGYGVNFGWIDITSEVSDLYKLKITWSEQRDTGGSVQPGSSQVKKAASGNLSIEGDAYRLLKQWLADDISAALNAVEVKIEESQCQGSFDGFVIKPSDVQWCEDGICEFSVVLKQADELLNCMKRTFIFDNHQGWFPEDGKPLNKKHPRFAYCVEHRPNGMMLALWYIMGQCMAPVMFMMMTVLFALNGISISMNLIINAVNSLGGNLPTFPVFNLNAIFDSFSTYYVETAGCGREHPAPLIRDYISNVCQKCGLTVDAVTAPIFFAQTISIQTSDPKRGKNGVITAKNPHYNACYFYPQVKRGIRRFNSVNVFGASPQNSECWIDDNRPLLYLDMLLDQLKPLYNAEWRVRNGKLYFWRKDWFLDGNYVYDFTGEDRQKILEGICFEPSEIKYPAACVGLYTTDGTEMNESGGSNGAGQMNGVVEFGKTDNNPNFEGLMQKTAQFGATKFNLDGASGCYYFDALQELANAGFINLTNLFQTGPIYQALHDYGDYALLMQGDTCELPKILLWNGDTYTNARCISPKAAWDGIAPEPMPTNNPVYYDAAKGIQPWKYRHHPNTRVIGSALVLGAAPDGIYQVANFFGAPLAEQPALLVNFPMYFEPFYYDTMWDWFHWIDDPLRNPVLNFNWRVKLDLCCEDLLDKDSDGKQKLGLLYTAENIALGSKVKLPFQYYRDGIIKEITVSFDPTNNYGQYIELSGTL